MDPNALIKKVQFLRDEDFLTWGSMEEIYELFEDLKDWLDKGGFEPTWKIFPGVLGQYEIWLKANGEI